MVLLMHKVTGIREVISRKGCRSTYKKSKQTEPLCCHQGSEAHTSHKQASRDGAGPADNSAQPCTHIRQIRGHRVPQ